MAILAIHVQLLPVERPSFSEVNARLVITLEDLDERSGHGSVERVDSIEPQPSYRLSYHEVNRSRSKSLSPIPTDLTNSRQTTVWYFLLHAICVCSFVYVEIRVKYSLVINKTWRELERWGFKGFRSRLLAHLSQFLSAIYAHCGCGWET